jgi:hypothetical protein
MPPQFSPDERGTSSSERGTSTAPLRNAQPAPPPAPSVPESPVPGVIFLLDQKGHVAAGYSEAEAAELVRRTRAYSQRVRESLAGAVSFEVFEFGSFAELLSKAPGKHRGKKWRNILLVTHGPGERLPEMAGGIFLGDKEYIVGGSFNDLLDFANDPKGRQLVEGFRKNVSADAAMQIIACGVANHGPEAPIYMRQLFGTEGAVITPRVDVGFDRKSGRLGAYMIPPDEREDMPISDLVRQPIRPLRDNEWMVIPPITVPELLPVDPAKLTP